MSGGEEFRDARQRFEPHPSKRSELRQPSPELQAGGVRRNDHGDRPQGIGLPANRDGLKSGEDVGHHAHIPLPEGGCQEGNDTFQHTVLVRGDPASVSVNSTVYGEKLARGTCDTGLTSKQQHHAKGGGTMSDSVMVIVADLDDAKHGEINVVESPQKAARLVETLLEAGFDQGRIRVFSGGEMDMRVRHRPVVAFVTGDEATENAQEEAATEQPVASGAKAETRKDAIAAELYQRNGQKFSTAFRPA